MGHPTRRILKNTVALGVARGIDMTVMVLTAAIVSRYLGPKLYGEYGFIVSLVTLLVSFTYFGTGRVAIRNIARDKEQAETTLGTALVTRWILSFLVMLVILVFLAVMNLGRDLKIAILITSISQLALSAAMLYNAVFNAYEKMEYEMLLVFLFQFLSLALVFSVVKLDLGFIPIFAAMALPDLSRFLFSRLLSNKKFIMPKIVLNAARIKAFLKDSFILGANLLIVQILLRVDILLLRAMKESTEVSLFFAPHSILVGLQIFPTAFSTALFPFLSRSAQNDPMALARGFNKAFRILAVISVFFVIVSMSCASSIITLIYGRAFVDAVLPFQILLPAAIFLFLHPLLSFVLIANDRQNLLIPASAGALIVNFVLDIVLIPGYGSAGASIASLAGYAVLFGVTFYFVNRHVVKVSLLKRV